ncbi:MAG: hypothetical protein JHD35_12430 [Sphingopyxis sp.]|nr:hypothetical protein [Sphingopyxis sp.]
MKFIGRRFAIANPKRFSNGVYEFEVTSCQISEAFIDLISGMSFPDTQLEKRWRISSNWNFSVFKVNTKVTPAPAPASMWVLAKVPLLIFSNAAPSAGPTVIEIEAEPSSPWNCSKSPTETVTPIGSFSPNFGTLNPTS